MNPSFSGIFVACTAAVVYVRVVGRGACRNSPPLREYGRRKLHEGYRTIVVDLHECEAMDSTFLGVFAGLGIALNSAASSGRLALLRMSADLRRSLIDLGLDQIGSIQTESAGCEVGEIPLPAAFELLPGSDLASTSRPVDIVDEAMLMLEAHECLCRLDTRNELKFHEVKQFLREDIARHTPPGLATRPGPKPESPK